MIILGLVLLLMSNWTKLKLGTCVLVKWNILKLSKLHELILKS